METSLPESRERTKGGLRSFLSVALPRKGEDPQRTGEDLPDTVATGKAAAVAAVIGEAAVGARAEAEVADIAAVVAATAARQDAIVVATNEMAVALIVASVVAPVTAVRPQRPSSPLPKVGHAAANGIQRRH